MATFPGTPGNDTLTGTGVADLFLGSGGSDTIDGGDLAPDTLTYQALFASLRVTVSSSFGTVEKRGFPNAGLDRFTGIERLIASAYDDLVIASAAGFGFEITGGAGNDLIDGAGNPANVVSYADARSVLVDLAAGFARADHGRDTLINVRSVIGSPGHDLLIGTAGADNRTGGAGDDILQGGPGFDHLTGGPGRDTAVFQAPLTALTFDAGSTRLDFGPRVTSARDGTDVLNGIDRIEAAGRLYGQGIGVTGVDTLTYYVNNADVARAGVDAEAHYFADGWREGRDPGNHFSTNAYLAVNPDVRAAGVNPLQHYIDHGAREGRDPTLAFDSETYLARNPDVRAAGLNPFLHHLAFGAEEGRATALAIGPGAGRNGFDREFYLFLNPELAGLDPETHYRTIGFREGRDPDAWFDTTAYLATHADVAAAGIDPLNHYVTQGWREGRDPSAAFDTTLYLRANPDVATANINPLLHYLADGHAEGRVPPTDNVLG